MADRGPRAAARNAGDWILPRGIARDIRATSRRSVARKLLVIANAVIRDGRAWDPKMAAAA